MKRFRPSANPTTVRASGDRWLFGYADIVTLLLACFVCLYASTLAPASEASPVKPPLSIAALALVPVPASSAPQKLEATSSAPAKATPPTVSSLESNLRVLFGERETTLGVELSSSDRGLIVSVPEAGSFPAGQAELSPAARLVMLSLAAELKDRSDAVRVEGHTDDVPIRTSRFRSNWELSTARATSVVQFLIEEGGIAPGRLAAAGYAEYRPKVPNDSPDSRARNRRVDIVVLQPEAASLESGLAGALGIRP